MWSTRSVERAAIHQVPGPDWRSPVGSDVRVVVVVADAERGVRDLVANRVDALALRDPSATGVAPGPHARHPARPRDVTRPHPPRLGRIGVAPFGRDVLARLELHL